MKTYKEIELLIRGCFGETEWNNVHKNAKVALIELFKQRDSEKSYTQEQVDELLDRNTCQVTAQVLKNKQEKPTLKELCKDADLRNEVVELLKFFIKDTRGGKPFVDADIEWIENNI